MKLTSHHERLMGPIDAAFTLAVADTLEDARSEASAHSRSGRFERSLIATATRHDGDRLEASIGSPLASARAKEKGAYIEAKRGPYLVFKVADGTFRKVRSVRLPKRPVVTVAGPRFIDHMTERLRAMGR